MKKKILIVIGTRPEALKLCPLIMELKLHKHKYKTYVCSTGQHMEMLDEVFSFFKIKPDFELGLMNNSLNQIDLIAKAMVGIQKIIFKIKPDILFVQGDTNSCMAGSIAGFFNKIKAKILHSILPSEPLVSVWLIWHMTPTPTYSSQHLGKTIQYSGLTIKEYHGKDQPTLLVILGSSLGPTSATIRFATHSIYQRLKGGSLVILHSVVFGCQTTARTTGDN